MKKVILTISMLALAILFYGCDKASAQDTKKAGQDHNAKTPSPHAILIIDEVAYIDGCKGCDCVEEDICVCEAKADCDCCRKNLKKVPHEMQEKCKAIKKNHAAKTANCKECKKDGKSTACNDQKDHKDEAKTGK